MSAAVKEHVTCHDLYDWIWKENVNREMASDCAKVKDKYWDKEDKDQVKGALYGSHG